MLAVDLLNVKMAEVVLKNETIASMRYLTLIIALVINFATRAMLKCHVARSWGVYCICARETKALCTSSSRQMTTAREQLKPHRNDVNTRHNKMRLVLSLHNCRNCYTTPRNLLRDA